MTDVKVIAMSACSHDVDIGITTSKSQWWQIIP